MKNQEEIYLILEKVARSQHIENFEADSNSEANYGDGFVGQLYMCSVRNKDTGKITAVAIKKAPLWEFDYNPIFKNENAFYSDIFPALDDLQKEIGVSKPFDNVPKYFCGEVDSKKVYIALENVKPLGYVMFDKTQYLDKHHLEMIFKIYGKFHALSYVLRNKNQEKYMDVSKNVSNLLDQMAEILDKPMTAAITAAVEALDHESDKIIYEEIRDLGEHAVKTFLNSFSYNGEHRCLVHGDCWSNNMLFKYSESGELLDIKLIDFQLCQENTPVHDLSYFFYSGASKEDFDNLDSYLQIYYKSFFDFSKELGAQPEEIFSFETLKNEWQENALFGVFLGIYLWQIKLTPKENLTDLMQPNAQEPSMEDKMKEFQGLLDAVHKTDEYRKRTTAILRHAFEYGILNKDKIVRNK